MKASPLQLSKFLQKQDTQFVIPIYQRNYDWSEEHCMQILEDIIAGYLDAIRSYDDLEDFIAICNASIEDWNAYARRRI